MRGREFEWDGAKAASNLAKHGISFEVATRVFDDAAFVDLEASFGDAAEIRRKAVGSINGRIFTVVYTVRNQSIRIISARRSNAREVRSYGQSTLHAGSA
jgi:uncharacterized DUF497 family protein